MKTSLFLLLFLLTTATTTTAQTQGQVSRVVCKYPYGDFVPGESLAPGEFICNGNYRFGLTEVGDLALVVDGTDDTNDDMALFSAGITGGVSVTLTLDEGSLVVLDAAGQILWQRASGGGAVYVEDDVDEGVYAYVARANDNIYSNNKVYWRSDTGLVHGGGHCKEDLGESEDFLKPGDFLERNDYLCLTPDLIFGLDDTGDVVLADVSNNGREIIWSANSTGSSVLRFAESGNLQAEEESSSNRSVILWETKTSGGKYVIVEHDEEGNSAPYIYVADGDSFFSPDFVYWRSTTQLASAHAGGSCKFNAEWPSSDSMAQGSVLLRNEYLCLDDNPNLVFGLDATGDLCLMDATTSTTADGVFFKVWSAGTSGTSVNLTDTGNLLVIGTSDEEVQWQSNTTGAQFLRVEVDKENLRNSFAYLQQEDYGPELAYWRSDDAPAFGGGECLYYQDESETLEVGGVLQRNQYICGSASIIFGVDNSGDLALIDVSTPDYVKIWSAGTSGESNFATLDESGNLAVYSDEDTVVFAVTDIRGGLYAGVVVNEKDITKSFAYISDSSYPGEGIQYWRSNSNGGGVYLGGVCKYGPDDMVRGDMLRPREYICGSKDIVFGLDETGNAGLMDVSGANKVFIWCAGTTGVNNVIFFEQDASLSVYSDETMTDRKFNLPTNSESEYLGVEVAANFLDESFIWTGQKRCTVCVAGVPPIYETTSLWTSEGRNSDCGAPNSAGDTTDNGNTGSNNESTENSDENNDTIDDEPTSNGDLSAPAVVGLPLIATSLVLAWVHFL